MRNHYKVNLAPAVEKIGSIFLAVPKKLYKGVVVDVPEFVGQKEPLELFETLPMPSHVSKDFIHIATRAKVNIIWGTGTIIDPPQVGDTIYYDESDDSNGGVKVRSMVAYVRDGVLYGCGKYILLKPIEKPTQTDSGLTLVHQREIGIDKWEDSPYYDDKGVVVATSKGLTGMEIPQDIVGKTVVFNRRMFRPYMSEIEGQALIPMPFNYVFGVI
jgi:hypothetical protein